MAAQEQNEGEGILSYMDAMEAGIVEEEDAEPRALDESEFGEYLVHEGAISRDELAEAKHELRLQPGVRLGEVIAFMGYLPYADVDRLLAQWRSIPVLDEPDALDDE